MFALVKVFAAWFAPIIATGTGILTAAMVTVTAVAIEQGTGLISELLALIAEQVLTVVMKIVSHLINLLPTMPAAPPVDMQGLADILGLANRYLPIFEAFERLALLGVIVGGVFTWKLFKAVRG